MAETQLDRIERKFDAALTKLGEQTVLLRTILTEILIMATNQETLQAALDAVNAATSQEAALLAADTTDLGPCPARRDPARAVGDSDTNRLD